MSKIFLGCFLFFLLVLQILLHLKHKCVFLWVCIDVIVQRLGDATAAGIYSLLFSRLEKKATMVTLYALPV